MATQVVLETTAPGLRLFKRGKVRDLYDLGDHLLIVATDRISAFDVVLPTGIPHKGQVLTALSAFWFAFVRQTILSHVVSADWATMTVHHPQLIPHAAQLAGRTMLVKKTEVIPIECVVRGYLAGSGWKEYRESSSICGVKLPKGLRESDRLPEPIFTPATKAETGHDLNISEEDMTNRIGAALTKTLKTKSLAIYQMASRHAESKGIILADTKFEFGMIGGEVILIDELLTPDSSRFWPQDSYQPGKPQVSFDKQFVRDYLEEIGWNKMPPAPALPEEIVQKTSAKYLQAFQQLTG